MKTVKQIADELGVSKQAVHQKRKNQGLSTALQPFTSTVDGVVYISVDGETLLKSAFTDNDRKAVDDNEPSTVDGHVDSQRELYVILKGELAAKNQQIAAQNQQIVSLQAELAVERQHSRAQSVELAALAKVAQKLHAGTIQSNHQLTGFTLEYNDHEPDEGDSGESPLQPATPGLPADDSPRKGFIAYLLEYFTRG